MKKENPNQKDEVSSQAPQEASESQTNNIEMIPIKNIVPHPLFDTGIRGTKNEGEEESKEFRQLVADIKLHMLNQAVVVRPNGDNMFELGIGHHRWRAYQELNKTEKGYERIKAEIRHIDDDAEWGEIIINDNRNRIDYTQAQLEDLTYNLWLEGQKTGRYKDYKDLAKALDITATWVKNRIEVRELRDKAKEYAEIDLDSISTQSMLYAKELVKGREETGMEDLAKFLEVCIKDHCKTGEIKERAEEISRWPKEYRDKVLNGEEPYTSVKLNYNQEDSDNKSESTSEKTPETSEELEVVEPLEVPKETEKPSDKTTKSKPKERPDNILHNYIKSLSGEEKEKAIKETVLRLCAELLDERWISEAQFNQIKQCLAQVTSTNHRDHIVNEVKKERGKDKATTNLEG